MAAFVIDPPEVPTIPVAGLAAQYPVRRVYCIGRNYADHAREMGGDPDREAPFFFCKPADSLDASGRFPYPPASKDVHHEVELLVALGAGGRDVAAEAALGLVYGYAVALDMTRRDLQGEAKRTGRPWDVAKGFDCSAPVGPLHPATTVGQPAAGRIALTVNGEIRQEGDLNQMVWSVPEMIATLSGLFELCAGDVILTGTPAGVGPVVPGDVMVGEIAGLGQLEVRVTA